MNYEFQCRKNYCSVLGDSTIINVFYCIRYQLPVCLWLRRCKETSVFAVAHILSHFFLCLFNVSFYEIPGIYYVCNFLPCPIFVPRSYRRGKRCFQNNFSLLILLQQYNPFSLCPIWLPFRHFLFSTVTNSNIQTHPTLNVYPHKVIQACIIYLLKN